MHIKQLIGAGILATVLMVQAGCAPTVDTHGNLISDTKLSQVRPNISSMADVETAWGPPTTVAPFNENVWYYIGTQTETNGIIRHEVVKRRVIRVMFDDTDTVTDIKELNTKDAKEIEFVERETPTAGKEFTAFQQMIGNVGRFSKEGGARNPASVNP